MRFSVSKILMLLWLLLMFIQPAQAKISETATPVDDKMACQIETRKQENNFQIKEHLLTAISNVESGRWDADSKRNLAWPWTVNAEGKGMFFNSKAEAVREVKRLQKKGVKSIDVGCMQVNLSYHGENFASVEDAFDPAKNVEYAAKFLKKLYSQKGSWMQSAMAYHSSVSEKADTYKQKIAAAFDKVKKAHNADLKLAAANATDTKAEPQPVQVAMDDNPPTKIEIVAQPSAKPDKATQKTAAENANEWREARLQEYRLRRMK